MLTAATHGQRHVLQLLLSPYRFLEYLAVPFWKLGAVLQLSPVKQLARTQ